MAKRATLTAVQSNQHYSENILTSNFNALNSNFDNFLHLDGVGESGNTFLGNIDLGGFRILNVAAPSASFDVINRAYVDAQVIDSNNGALSVAVQIDTTDTFSFANGTAAAPSMANTGDLDTGFFFPIENAIGMAATGTEILRIIGNTDLTDAVVSILATTASSSSVTGALIVAGGVGIAGTLSIVNGEFTGVISGDHSYSEDIKRNGSISTPRLIKFQTLGDDRWEVGADNSAESGSDAGSNFYIKSIPDTGFGGVTGLTISRATGVVTLNIPLITQPNSGAAVPALDINQSDIVTSFIDFIGTSSAGSSNSISSSTGETAAKGGAFKVDINGTTKWIRVYDSAV